MRQLLGLACRGGLHHRYPAFCYKRWPVGVDGAASTQQVHCRFFVEISEKKAGPVRRFYSDVGVQPAPDAGKWNVTLDQRTLKTPKGSALDLPTKALAQAIAEE